MKTLNNNTQYTNEYQNRRNCYGLFCLADDSLYTVPEMKTSRTNEKKQTGTVSRYGLFSLADDAS